MDVRYLIGILMLALAFPIGMLLAKFTKEELKTGQKYFKMLIGLCLLGVVVSLIFGKVELIFTFLFMAIVTGMSLWVGKGRMRKSIKRL